MCNGERGGVEADLAGASGIKFITDYKDAQSGSAKHSIEL
jgi:hypothetical protein